MRQVFLLKEEYKDLNRDEVEALLWALESQCDEPDDRNIRAIIQRCQGQLDAYEAYDSDIDADASVDIPSDQRTQTLIMGAILAAIEHEKHGTGTGPGPMYLPDTEKTLLALIKDLDLKHLPMSSRTAAHVANDPHASPKDKVAADRELEKQ